mgnify:CR=1 FL=1
MPQRKALILTIIVIAVIICVAVALLLIPRPTPKTEIIIFTGGTGGVYFPLGSKYAELLNKYAGDIITASARTSGASVANARALAEGKANVILLQNDIAYYAYHGLYMFKETGKIDVMRGIATLYPETIQFVVRADSPVKSLYDLAGKRVAVGAAGSGTAVACEQILRAAGVWDKIEKVWAPFREAATMLKLGEVDCAMLVAGIPTPAVSEIATTTPVRILPIPDEILKKLHEEGYVFYIRQIAPKDTYRGMTEDVPTVAVLAMLACRADLPEDIVYTLTKVLFEHVDELRRVHAKAKAISLETALDGMSIPLHPGAIKYYEEKGIKVPEELKP